MRRFSLVLALACVSGGCGDDAPPSAPADAGQAVADASVLVTPPVPPAPPVLTPCPAGWTEQRTPSAIAFCSPWPAGAPPSCLPGEVLFPGASACAAVGAACPADGWPAGLPTNREVFYVSSSAAAGGDGTLARPFLRIRDAVARARLVGGIVAIGRGRYDEPVGLLSGIELWGACPAETVLTSTVAADTGVLSKTTAGTAVVRNLTVADSVRRGVVVDGSAARLELDGIVFERVTGIALAAFGGGAIVAHDVVVREMRVTADGVFGRAVTVEMAGSVELRRAVLSGCSGASVVSTGIDVPGASVTLEDVAIADTSPLASGEYGIGVAVDNGATATLRRVVVERSTGHGVSIDGPTAAIDLEDVVVLDTRPQAADGAAGQGIVALRGGTIRGRRVRSERNSSGNVTVYGGGDIRLEDVLLRDPTANSRFPHLAVGASIEAGGVLALTRVAVERSLAFGVLVDGIGSVAELEDLVVRDTLPSPTDDSGGQSLNVQSGSHATIRRALFERSRRVGLFVDDGAVLDAEDVTVRDTDSDGPTGTYGRGVQVQTGAVVMLTRGRVERAREVGIALVGSGSRAVLVDVAIVDTLAQACGETTCSGFGAGHGMSSGDGASLTARRFTIERATVCGAIVANAGMLDLSDGLVRATEIGACIQVDGYDVARLTRGVLYLDNGTNVQATHLPVPFATSPI